MKNHFKNISRVLAAAFVLLNLFNACKKDKPSLLPTATTKEISYITTVGARVKMDYTSPGDIYGANTEYGICWSTVHDQPSLADSKNAGSNGNYYSISDLSPNTLCYVRAYCTNLHGTAYGEVKTFTTVPATVKDADNNTYNAITIGNLVWMKENLRTTKFNDVITSIPLRQDDASWSATTQAAYCINPAINNYKDTYGLLYNWYAVATGFLAPKGWHVATEEEWLSLVDYTNNEADKVKAISALWETPNTNNNQSGFTALPGSRRFDDGSFSQLGAGAYFWQNNVSPNYPQGDHIAYYFLTSNTTTIKALTTLYKSLGYSIRCVKDYDR